jgi:hypothetical protein
MLTTIKPTNQNIIKIKYLLVWCCRVSGTDCHKMTRNLTMLPIFFSNSSGVNIQISTVFYFSREILFYFILFSLDENRHMIEKKTNCFYKN